jgi:hypothetical protein
MSTRKARSVQPNREVQIHTKIPKEDLEAYHYWEDEEESEEDDEEDI